MRFSVTCTLALALSTFCAISTSRADLTETLKPATPGTAMDIKQAGPLAFAPDGVLFIGDAQQGAIYAIATGDTTGDASKVKIDVQGIDKQIAAMLGTTPADILINDLVANPASGNVYLSVSRGRGANALPVVVRVDAAGKLTELKLAEARFAKATLDKIPDAANQRSQSITDLAYADGKVIVAGLSNEEFASKLRTLEFPFKGAAGGGGGASVEIYHGNHGRIETRSPVRSFVTLDVKGQLTILAGYTCTPLVTFPMADLKGGAKVTGKTVAELGMGNNPLDIITYKKGGKEFLLVNNSRYGVMKLSTDELTTITPITQPVGGGTGGIKAETITALTNVAHLGKLNADNAILLVTANGASELRTVPLP